MKALNATDYAIELKNARLPVIIRKHPRSRRIVIRYQPEKHAVSLTLPRYVTIRQGLRFVEEKRGWIEGQIEKRGGRMAFADGALIPVLGKTYRLRHIGGRGVVRIEGEEILVTGEKEFMPRRITDWLKTTAKETIARLAGEKATLLGKEISRISLRDTRSRWGSCTHNGRLSFSWRLVLAPYEVMDYVVCHEVAHLTELNHSRAFWQVVENLCPDYEKPLSWIKTHGHTLHAYG